MLTTAARLWVLCLLVALLAGCAPSDSVDATYGRRRGSKGAKSVNGTSVLAGMFEQAGHRVTSWRRLSPKLDNDQVIVWWPDDFAPPDDQQMEFLEQWLTQEDGRTLIYVGRDYEAELAYWRKMMPQASPEQAIEMQRRLARAQAQYDSVRAALPVDHDDGLFTLKRGTPGPVGDLSGPWAENVDASRAEIQLDCILEVPQPTAQKGEDDGDDQKHVHDEVDEEGAEVGKDSQEDEDYWSDEVLSETLLQSGDDILACRIQRSYWRSSQVIVIANGSFLLNLPLVNSQHRKLAGRLIQECGPPGRVAFLESGPGGPPLSDDDPGYPTGMEAFTVWPVSAIMLHVTVLGMLTCFWLFPIFGRPRELPAESPADFGKHVEALGELLEKTADEHYASQRVKHYHQTLKRESTVDAQVDNLQTPLPISLKPETRA